MRRLTTRLLISLGVLFAFAPLAAAEEFRMETKVFLGDEPEPFSENLTLFREGAVFDFLEPNGQIAIYYRSPDGGSGKFTLLSPAKEQRCDIQTDEIIKYVTRLQAWAAAHDNPLLKFASNPRFAKEFDAREGMLTLSSEQITYRLVTIEAENEAALEQYREFCDWYARLGAMLYPGSMPPFPRLWVNMAISEHQVIPREVHRTIPGREPSVARSEHRIAWRLSKRDRERIDAAEEYLVEFEQVDLDTFRH